MCGRRVPFLDDSTDRAGRVANDSAVSVGILEFRRQHSGRSAGCPVGFDKAGQRSRLQQGHVGVEQQDRALFALEHGFRLQQRVAGAQLRGLHHKLEIGSAGQRGPHLVSPVANHKDFGRDVELVHGAQNVFNEGATRQVMQHLREGRLHTRAFAGRENDDMEIVVIAHRSC